MARDQVKKGILGHLAEPGGRIEVQVTPRAAADSITCEGAVIRARVTAPADEGRANAAVRKLLARALGVPATRLTLVRGAKARTKVFRVVGPD